MRGRLFLMSLAIAVVVSAALLLHGPLFAWSPVTPGYGRLRDGRLLFLHRAGQPPAELNRLKERDVAALESAFGLQFGDAVTIVMCDEWDDLRRFTPWLPVLHDVASRTVEFGTVVYLTPLARERTDASEFLRHELVHVLLLRHTPLSTRTQLKDHWWPMEGLAVRYGNPGVYPMPGPERLQELRGSFATVLSAPLAQSHAASVSEQYAVAGGLIGYLEQVYGRPSVHQFVHSYLRTPADWQALFERTFYEPFADVAAAFGRSLDEKSNAHLDPPDGPDPADLDYLIVDPPEAHWMNKRLNESND